MMDQFDHHSAKQYNGNPKGVGNGVYVVKQGDCIRSIAAKHSMNFETIWNAPQNKALKEARKKPGVLMPGDRLFIPEKQQKQVDCPTGERHRFKRKGVQSTFTVFLNDCGEPRKDQPYKLIFDNTILEGQTDDQGKIEAVIPSHIKKVKALVGENEEPFVFDFGKVDPLDTVSGVQTRLANLGFYDEPITGIEDMATKNAISDFQSKYELEVNGSIDEPTLKKLEEIHKE